MADSSLTHLGEDSAHSNGRKVHRPLPDAYLSVIKSLQHAAIGR